MLKFSTYEKAFEELLENEGLKKKAAKSGISYGTLKKVYNRGMAAWRTGHRPGTTPQQWGMARVNSYIGKGKGTYYGADADLRGAKRKTKKEALDDKDKSTVKDVIKGLKKAVNIHKSQAASLTKDIKDNVNEAEYHPIKSSYHNDMAKAHASHAKRHKSEGDSGKHNSDNEDMHYRAIDIHKQAHDAHIRARDAASSLNQSKYKKAARDAHEYSKTAIGTTKDAGKFKTGTPKHSFPKLKLHTKLTKLNIKSESTVKEISKGLAKNYIGKASRDVYFKGRDQATKDAISQLGGPNTDYKKSPERKAAMRMRGIDRATNRLAKKEATTTDAERKAIDAFIKKGKMKKLKPGYAAGYHGKSDPGAGMKGMISPADTKQFGTKKKVGSMK